MPGSVQHALIARPVLEQSVQGCSRIVPASALGTSLASPKPSYTAYGVMTSELDHPTFTGTRSGGGVEGYDFNVGGRIKSVVWATQASANVAFAQSCVRRVDLMGTVTTPIMDGDPAWDQDSVAGQITLQVLQDQPLYVSRC